MGHAAQPVRVLYVEGNEDHTVGGSHRSMFDLVVRLPRERYVPVVLFYQDNVYVERLRQAGVPVLLFDAERVAERSINARWPRLLRHAALGPAIWRRYRLLRRERIGLVHLNNSPNAGSDDWLPAAWLASIPCVVSAKGFVIREQRRLRRILFRRFDRVIAISRHVADDLLACGTPPNRLALVYEGVDIEGTRAQVKRTRQAVRRELALSEDHLMLLMVGNIRHWKGQHVVLAAVGQLPSSVRERAQLVFVGATSSSDASYARELQEIIAGMGLESNVSFLGVRDDVPDLLNACDIAVHASIRPEPFGLVVAEAMVLAKAVIASRIGGPAEILTPESGVLFDPTNTSDLAAKLRELMEDPSRRTDLGREAAKRIERFAVAHTAQRIAAVYDTVLHGS